MARGGRDVSGDDRSLSRTSVDPAGRCCGWSNTTPAARRPGACIATFAAGGRVSSAPRPSARAVSTDPVRAVRRAGGAVPAGCRLSRLGPGAAGRAALPGCRAATAKRDAWWTCTQGELRLADTKAAPPRPILSCVKAKAGRTSTAGSTIPSGSRPSRPAQSAQRDDADWPATVMLAYDDEFLYIAVRCRAARNAPNGTVGGDSRRECLRAKKGTVPMRTTIMQGKMGQSLLPPSPRTRNAPTSRHTPRRTVP